MLPHVIIHENEKRAVPGFSVVAHSVLPDLMFEINKMLKTEKRAFRHSPVAENAF
jgi:hypothetical protein